MKKYKIRFINTAIENAIETFGAVVIEGAKAVGKSTSALHVALAVISNTCFLKCRGFQC